MTRLLLVIALLLGLAAPAAAHTGGHRTTLGEVEDEVMCPTCGTTLQLAQSPLADRQRALILKLVERDYTKQQIKAALVDELGEQVLATPPRRGFSLTAYAVPALLLLTAAGSIPFALRRWRRCAGGAPAEVEDPACVEDPEAARLDAELARGR
jgi:cytochrome c-type biogenesis protein CcmH